MNAAEESAPVVIGIDPGTRVMGYALVKTGKKPVLLTMGTLGLEKIEDHPTRLYKIFERISQLIEGYQPTVLAIEAPFFTDMVETYLAVLNASKEQVSALLSHLFALDLEGEKLDATDALAVAMCHYFQTSRLPQTKGNMGVGVKSATKTKKNKGGWEAYLRQNPGKVI